MTVLANDFIGGYDIFYCECGVKLCWSITEIEYFERKIFWDNYCCEVCNPDAKGAWIKANPQRTLFHGIWNKGEMG